MNKTALVIIVTASIFATSCKKSPNSTIETFSFKGTSYTVNTVTAQTGVMVATVVPPFDPSTTVQLSCTFPDTTLPIFPGSYYVVNGTPSTNQVALSVSFNSGQQIYKSTGGNGTQKVAVTISGGKVTVVGSNITMLSGTDTASINLNITQQ
jgi:hypothetical protein